MVNYSKVSHPKKVADTFNNFFSTAVEQLILPQFPHYLQNDEAYSLLNHGILVDRKFSLQSIEKQDVKKVIASFRIKYPMNRVLNIY